MWICLGKSGASIKLKFAFVSWQDQVQVDRSIQSHLGVSILSDQSQKQEVNKVQGQWAKDQSPYEEIEECAKGHWGLFSSWSLSNQGPCIVSQC